MSSFNTFSYTFPLSLFCPSSTLWSYTILLIIVPRYYLKDLLGEVKSLMLKSFFWLSFYLNATFLYDPKIWELIYELTDFFYELWTFSFDLCVIEMNFFRLFRDWFFESLEYDLLDKSIFNIDFVTLSSFVANELS